MCCHWPDAWGRPHRLGPLRLPIRSHPIRPPFFTGNRMRRLRIPALRNCKSLDAWRFGRKGKSGNRSLRTFDRHSLLRTLRPGSSTSLRRNSRSQPKYRSLSNQRRQRCLPVQPLLRRRQWPWIQRHLRSFHQRRRLPRPCHRCRRHWYQPYWPQPAPSANINSPIKRSSGFARRSRAAKQVVLSSSFIRGGSPDELYPVTTRTRQHGECRSPVECTTGCPRCPAKVSRSSNRR